MYIEVGQTLFAVFTGSVRNREIVVTKVGRKWAYFGNTARELYADTPENRRVLRAAITLRQKNGRQRTKMDLAERSALNKAARVSAE